MKTQSIFEGNKKLGGLLENAVEIATISQFANELKNYFNVLVKQCIKSQAPELAEEADSLLNCNEESRFLPKSKRVFGGVKKKPVQVQEEKVVEEVKTEQEPMVVENVSESSEESQKEDISKDELLDLLMNDDDMDLFGSDEASASSDSSEQVSNSEETSVESEDDEDEDIEKLLKDLEDFFKNSGEDKNNSSDENIDGDKGE